MAAVNNLPQALVTSATIGLDEGRVRTPRIYDVKVGDQSYAVSGGGPNEEIRVSTIGVPSIGIPTSDSRAIEVAVRKFERELPNELRAAIQSAKGTAPQPVTEGPRGRVQPNEQKGPPVVVKANGVSVHDWQGDHTADEIEFTTKGGTAVWIRAAEDRGVLIFNPARKGLEALLQPADVLFAEKK